MPSAHYARSIEAKTGRYQARSDGRRLTVYTVRRPHVTKVTSLPILAVVARLLPPQFWPLSMCAGPYSQNKWMVNKTTEPSINSSALSFAEWKMQQLYLNDSNFAKRLTHNIKLFMSASNSITCYSRVFFICGLAMYIFVLIYLWFARWVFFLLNHVNCTWYHWLFLLHFFDVLHSNELNGVIKFKSVNMPTLNVNFPKGELVEIYWKNCILLIMTKRLPESTIYRPLPRIEDNMCKLKMRPLKRLMLFLIEGMLQGENKKDADDTGKRE